MRTDIEMTLEGLEGFDDPSEELEQYATPAPLASRVVHLAWSHDDLGRVLDLGCGTGFLGIGAALAGADTVVGVEIDARALATARRNSAATESGVSFIRGDVDRLPLAGADGPSGFDTVVMNPPFGAGDPNRGADRPFLRAAESLSDVAYTVHNEGSLGFVESFVDGEVTHAFEARMALPRTFEFHTEDRHEISVEVYRIEFSADV